MFDRFWLATNKNFAGLNLQPISGSTNGNLPFLAPEPVFLDVMENPKCFRRATAPRGNLFQGMRVFWGLFGSFGLIFVPLTNPTRLIFEIILKRIKCFVAIDALGFL